MVRPERISSRTIQRDDQFALQIQSLRIRRKSDYFFLPPVGDMHVRAVQFLDRYRYVFPLDSRLK